MRSQSHFAYVLIKYFLFISWNRLCLLFSSWALSLTNTLGVVLVKRLNSFSKIECFYVPPNSFHETVSRHAKPVCHNRQGMV